MDAAPPAPAMARELVVSLSTLGSGSLGKSLLAFAFLKGYARRHNLRVETPSWFGQKLFGHVDPPISRTLPPAPDSDTLLEEVVSPLSQIPYCEIDFGCWFPRRSAHYAPFQAYVRSLFRPVPALAAHMPPRLAALRERGKTLVGIDLRPGDDGVPLPPAAWHAEWLRGLWDTLNQPVLFVAAESPDLPLPELAPYSPVFGAALGPRMAGMDWFPDFYLLGQCDVVAISATPLSFAAAMANEQAKLFARPHFPSAKLIPFDPWNSAIVLPSGS